MLLSCESSKNRKGRIFLLGRYQRRVPRIGPIGAIPGGKMRQQQSKCCIIIPPDANVMQKKDSSLLLVIQSSPVLYKFNRPNSRRLAASYHAARASGASARLFPKGMFAIYWQKPERRCACRVVSQSQNAAEEALCAKSKPAAESNRRPLLVLQQKG